MGKTNTQAAANFANLHAAYQAAWRCFSIQASRWQSLQGEERADALTIQWAEAAAGSAEQEYRRARNALTDYILEHSAAERELAAAG